MCQALGISRQSYYYEPRSQKDEAALEEQVVNSFSQSRKNYGSRKLKHELINFGLMISRRKIRKIMKKHGLHSTYTKLKYRHHPSGVNESKVTNILNREFEATKPLEKVVTDLTYVRVGNKWYYVCLILDLYNREIIGFSSGPNKSAELVKEAFQRIPYALNKIELFHTDRGKEFDNQLIDQILKTFDIQRSLSKKGCPYDNAVAESTYKSFKVEFVYSNVFKTEQELATELFDYVNWWNNWRLHGALDYKTPRAYKEEIGEACLEGEHKYDNVR